MFIDVNKALAQPGVAFNAEVSEKLKDFEYLKTLYTFASPVTLKTEYVFANDHIVLTGSFFTSFNVRCSKCGEDMVYEMQGSFNEIFSKNEEIFDSYPLKGDIAHLDRMIEDNITLNLPNAFSCADDCRGLCPVCGINQNTGSCDCEKYKRETNPFHKIKGHV